MMKNDELFKEVDTLRRFQQSITEREPHDTQLTDEAEDIDEETFVQLKQSQLVDTFYVPVEALQQWRGICSAEYGHESHDADGQVCLRCAKHCSNSAEMLIHLARNHYIPSMCSNPLRDTGRSAPALS
ncbi:hypothetical protein RvY_10588 [Ramazzottius varieornatus]|uniref:Uncharacterized protein n=1 Tax=Ramazzottius varieornatus TaxID=947166 RepID=A0A1D1VIM3_RAMVA|nr:hypothetical protein RvY_10588 [Ramazzottius varieornatus]